LLRKYSQVFKDLLDRVFDEQFIARSSNSPVDVNIFFSHLPYNCVDVVYAFLLRFYLLYRLLVNYLAKQKKKRAHKKSEELTKKWKSTKKKSEERTKKKSEERTKKIGRASTKLRRAHKKIGRAVTLTNHRTFSQERSTVRTHV